MGVRTNRPKLGEWLHRHDVAGLYTGYVFGVSDNYFQYYDVEDGNSWVLKYPEPSSGVWYVILPVPSKYIIIKHTRLLLVAGGASKVMPIDGNRSSITNERFTYV